MRKILLGVTLLASIAVVLFLVWKFIPKKPHVFLDELKEEKKASLISPADLAKIKSCNDENQCLQDFFQNYTLQKGRDTAFHFFNELIATDTELTSDCHYMFHGIGHGSLLLSGKNVEQAFALGSSTEFLMNIPTCGNGYYHGVIEEFVGDIPDKQHISGKLKNICEPILKNNPLAAVDCFHGLGHAILIEEDYDTQKAVALCDSITSDKKMLSMCHTGVFMEMLRSYKSTDDKVKTFSLCESLPTDMQKAECFNQQSYLFDDFLNHKDEFIENMKECEKNVKDMEDRIICIRKAKF